MLFRSAGYDILNVHPKTDAVVIVDGRRVAIPILADFLVTRGSQRFAVEVKSGKERHVTSGATRRQLLEYACAYDDDAVLLVDAVDRRILEVRFPYAGKYGS